MAGEKKGKLSKKRNNEFYEKYSYDKLYGDFYDSTKQDIWEVIGNGDGSLCYDPIPYQIKTSSVLENNQNYSSKNLYDNSFKTAWAEGAKGDGVGEYFEYYINNYTPVYKFLIKNKKIKGTDHTQRV
jgi:hypothetical protein